MATIEKFEDIEAWQKAEELDREIFALTQEEKVSRDFALKDQMLRASGSVMDNIAEGFERGGRKEFIQFLSYAKGSTGELRSQLYRAKNRGYITHEHFRRLYDESVRISKMIRGFISYLSKSEIKGSKYKVGEQ